MTAIEVTSDDQWHQLRKQNVGGSEIAALFDCSPWITRFSLWHEKAGKVAPNAEENDRMRLGKYMEPYIAGEMARKLGWKLERSKQYWIHPEITGMGCTLDFDITDHEWGPGICETKCVFDYSAYREQWAEDRAPPQYELQVQHQLAVTGRKWAAIAVLVMQTGTIMPAIIRRPSQQIINQIEREVLDFWDSIRAAKAPEPTGTDRELAILREIWPTTLSRKVVAIGDPDLNTEASLYRWATSELAGMERQQKASKAKLLAAAEDAELMRVPGFDVSIRKDKRGYTRLTVTEATSEVTLAPPRNTLEAG